MYRQHYSMALFIHSYFSMVVFLHTFMTHLYDILLQYLKLEYNNEIKEPNSDTILS